MRRPALWRRMTVLPTLLCAFLCGMVWNAASAHSAAITAVLDRPSDFAGGVALNARTVIGAFSRSCPEGRYRFGVSRDRATTWHVDIGEPCDAFHLRPDRYPPFKGRLVLHSSFSGVLIDENLTRKPLPELPVGWSSVGFLSTGSELIAKAARGSLLRLSADESRWETCGSMPGFVEPTTWGSYSNFLWATEAKLIAGRQRVPGGERTWFRSTDGCRSWTQIAAPMPIPNGCEVPDPTDPLAAVHAEAIRVVVACRNGPTYELRDDDGGRWQEVATSTDWPRFLLSASPTRVVIGDEFAHPAIRDTWPDRPRERAPDAGNADQSSAVEWINARFRRPLGIPDLRFDARLATAATNHASYLTMNPADQAAFHGERDGAPGFTGRSSGDRCRAAGYPGSCLEVGFASFDTLQGAVAGWARTPYHGAGFIDRLDVGFGQVGRISVGNESGSHSDLSGFVIDLKAPPNTAEASLRVWPANGTTDVPLSWWGGESPDPLANYGGDRRNIGPVLFIYSFRHPTRISLSGPSGPIPLLLPGGTAAATEVTTDSRPGVSGYVLAPMVAQHLAPLTTYTVTATNPDGRTISNTFTTAAYDPRVQLPRWLTDPDPPSQPSTLPKPMASHGKLTRLTAKPVRFRAGRHVRAKTRKRPGVGTRLTLRLTAPSRVVLTANALRPGRTAGKRCIVGRNKGKKCVRSVRVGKKALGRMMGTKTIKFTGRINGKRLKVGRYRLTATALDIPKSRGRTRSVVITVLR